MRLNSTKLRSAFSLIEIVLAIGIISFALVGILGLFPAAMNSAADSQRETQTALIAKRIFTDLSGKKPFVQKKGLTAKDANVVQVSLDVPPTSPIVVDYDEGGMPLGASAENPDLTTTDSPIYRATITIKANTPTAGVAKINLVLATPALAPDANQRTYPFATLLDQASAAPSPSPVPSSP